MSPDKCSMHNIKIISDVEYYLFKDVGSILQSESATIAVDCAAGFLNIDHDQNDRSDLSLSKYITNKMF